MESKQKIKDRILRRAANLWGYADSEIETNFDPIVAMLLEACGAELEKLSIEIDSSRSRVVERLIDIMSPESYTGNSPSHSIVYGLPVENNTLISQINQFLVKKSIANIYDPTQPISKDVYFGATADFELTNARINYLAFSNTIYEVKDALYRELLKKSPASLPSSELWLGIRVKEDTEVLKKLLFYTDTRNNYHRDFYLHNIRQAKIYIGEKRIRFKEGFNNSQDSLDVEEILTSNYNKITNISKEVNDFYSEKFFHLEENIILNQENKGIPEEIEKLFGKEIIEETENVVWLKIEFPQVMFSEVLEEVQISLNCFPVINKQLLKISQNINSFVNYIPLETDDFFLDIETISDSQGNLYHLNAYNQQNLEGGEAIVRQGGVARFGQRSASEHIQYLLDLLKDEAASFSVIGNDFVNNQLKQLHQLIAALEQQANEKQWTKSDYPYVMIKPKISKTELHNDFFSIEFWATVGEYANDIKSGTKLSALQRSAFEDSSVSFVLPTVGGKAKVTYQEKIASYREALLSKGRIVTAADIKVFAYSHFRQNIKSIEVKKGTEKDKSLKQGFVRTLEIILERDYDREPQLVESEWNYLLDSFLHKLKKRSSNVYPYKIKEKI